MGIFNTHTHTLRRNSEIRRHGRTHPSTFEIEKENFSLIQLDFSGVMQTHATKQEVMESFVEYLETEASEQHALDISRTHSVGHPGEVRV